MPFCESRSTINDAWIVTSSSSPRSPRSSRRSSGHLLTGDLQGLLAHELGDARLERLVGHSSVGYSGGPRASARRSGPAAGRPRLRASPTRARSPRTPRVGGGHQRGISRVAAERRPCSRRRWPARPSASAARRRRRRRAGSRRRVDHLHDSRRRRRVPHESFNRAPSSVFGLWNPGVSVNTICCALGVPDRADVSPRGLRLVRHDRDLLPDQRVHERGLPDVGPPDHRDDPAAEPRGRPAQFPGPPRSARTAGHHSSSAHAGRPSVPSRTTVTPGPNSHNTWRHPPHGGVGLVGIGHDGDRMDRCAPPSIVVATALRSAQTETG